MDKFSNIVGNVLNEGALADGIENDSWWYEERPKNNSAPVQQTSSEINHFQSSNVNSSEEQPATNVVKQKPFNAYEQCNKLILCCNSRLDIIQHFCDIIADLTLDNNEAQQKVLARVNELYSQQLPNESAQ